MRRLTGDESPIETVRELRSVVGAFYFELFERNVGTVAHAFIEFCGVMNEYLKIAGDLAVLGVDFRQLNKHTGAVAEVEPYRIQYLGEKLDCIFSPLGASVKLFAADADNDPEVFRADAPPSRVLIASDGKRARVLACVGQEFEQWSDDIGWEHQFDGIAPGLWIAQGYVYAYQDYFGECDAELVLTHTRELTPDEWTIYLDCDVSEGPWDESKWSVAVPSTPHPTDLPEGWE